LFRSVLQNFLSNAVRYTPSGAIFVGARRRGMATVVEVRDSGPGIAEADLGRIFREFERLETKGSAGAGVGLGLAIVERICRLLKLEVQVRSRPGEGSTFAVTIPHAKYGAEVPPSAQPAITNAVQGLTVLCVDNEPAILAGLEAALRSRGCVPLIAASAQQALALASAHRPSIALLDFQLGEDLDGLDLAAALRREQPDLRIALITADKNVRLDPRAAGLSVLLKPIDPDRLWDLLGQRTAEPA
jgi:CheY-like chemotaxis protein